MTTTTDVDPTAAERIDDIDRLAAIRRGGAIDTLRRRRPVTREQLQASADALFAPVQDSEISIEERLLVAAFATALTADDAVAAEYARRARSADTERAALVLDEAARASGPGPFGAYTEAGLQSENTEGVRSVPTAAVREALGDRLAAALVHTQLLVSRPREASSDALDALLGAGWSVEGIVTLSQLVSFLAFQQRVAAGLRVLAAASEDTNQIEEATA